MQQPILRSDNFYSNPVIPGLYTHVRLVGRVATIFLMLVCCSFVGQAQDRVITGKVVENNKDRYPIINGYVLLKGLPGKGAVTDFNGNYKLSVPAGITTLIFRYTGFKTVEIEIGSKTVIDLAMDEDVKTTQEVVITGFKTEKKVESTANIATVKGEAFQNNPTTSFEGALQGRAAGVQVTQSTGVAGAGFSVRVRGTGSVSAASEPLYIVDGVPIISGGGGDGGGQVGGGINAGFQLNPLADFNPSDIETLEILKDAAATAQYGSRGSNGVVVITTRKGKAGKTKFNASYFTGIEMVTHKISVLDGPQYLATIDSAYHNSYSSNPANVVLARTPPPLSNYLSVPLASGLTADSARKTNVNYLDHILRAGRLDEASVNASGGDAKTNFYVNGTYRRQEGALLGNLYQRASGKFNVNTIVSSKLRVGLSTNVVLTTNDLVPTSASSNGYQGFAAAQYRSLPIFPVYYNEVATGGNAYPFNPYYNAYGEFAGTNIFLTQDPSYTKLQRQVFRNISNLSLDYKILPLLTYRAELGLDFYNQVDFTYQSRYLRQSNINVNQPTSSAQDSRSYFTNFNVNQILTYTRDLDELNKFDFTLVQNYQRAANYNNGVSVEGFNNDQTTTISAGQRQLTPRQSSETAYAFGSGMLIGKYGFRNKYFAQASGRVEGSSRFGKNNRYGLFPSLGVNWVASEEDFIRDIQPISLLKFRASVGITGNAAGIGNFQSLGLYGNSATYNLYPGTTPSQLANPNLSYERSRQVDVSADLGLFANRIETSLTYYNKLSYNMLLALSIPPSQGIGGSYYTNAGRMRNQGLEFTLNTKNLVGKVKWTTDFNISSNQNRLLDIGGLRYNEVSGNPAIANYVGQQLSTFFLPEWAGVNDKGEELIYRAERDPITGDPTGRKTGEIFHPVRVGQLDSNRIAQTTKQVFPKFFGGITNTVRYAGIDFSLLVTYTYGNYILDDGERLQSYIGSTGAGSTSNNLRTSAIADGHPTLYYSGAPNVYGPLDIIPTYPYTINDPFRQRATTRFLHDGSYIRVKQVTLGYTFPAAWTKQIGLASLRIYGSASNLLTFTRYPGWDPEVSGNLASSQARNLQQGITTLDFPQIRSYIGGIQIGF